MSLDQQLSQLPKTLLAVMAISAAVIFMFVMNPPHSVCDTEAVTAKENLAGTLYPLKIKKDSIPEKLPRLRRDCGEGKSSGACYNYFISLKTVARQVDASTSDCRPQVFSIKEIQRTMKEGVEDMALLAWGPQPPPTSNQRFGWLQESELSVFCLLKEVYIKSLGEEAWNDLRLQINKKFPGELARGAVTGIEPPKAIEKLSDSDIWTRSIFSIRCDSLL